MEYAEGQSDKRRGLLISLSFKAKGCTELIALSKKLKIFFVLSSLEFLDCLFSAVKHGRSVGVAAVWVPHHTDGLATLSRKP